MNARADGNVRERLVLRVDVDRGERVDQYGRTADECRAGARAARTHARALRAAIEALDVILGNIAGTRHVQRLETALGVYERIVERDHDFAALLKAEDDKRGKPQAFELESPHLRYVSREARAWVRAVSLGSLVAGGSPSGEIESQLATLDDRAVSRDDDFEDDPAPPLAEDVVEAAPTPAFFDGPPLLPVLYVIEDLAGEFDAPAAPTPDSASAGVDELSGAPVAVEAPSPVAIATAPAPAGATVLELAEAWVRSDGWLLSPDELRVALPVKHGVRIGDVARLVRLAAELSEQSTAAAVTG